MTRRERRASWQRLVAKQAKSGLSAAAFCHRHRLNLHQFYRWRHRLRDDEAERNLAPSLLELVPYSPRGQSGIRICLGPEVSIEVERDFDPSTLRAVVNALGGKERRPCLP
jgi:hypothetical protein